VHALVGTPAPSAAEAYAAFAPYYDRYVAHPGYRRWITWLLDLAEALGWKGGPALDIGCGTGISTQVLANAGLEVVGCEPVGAMAAEARAKGVSEVLPYDATALPAIGRFGLVTMLNDVVNCLPSASDVEAAITGIARNLAPGGFVVLDANTIATYRTVFATTTTREHDEVAFTWTGRCDARFAAGDLAEARLDTIVPGAEGTRRRITCTHRQRHHPRQVLEAAFATAGLRLLRVFGQDADGVPQPGRADEHRHRKFVYVAARP
jgi:SAM-dependent methyltransferase